MTAARQSFKETYLIRQAGRLAGCEHRLTEVTGGPGGTLGVACSQTLKAGGKRMRPLLVFLSARGEPGDEPQVESAIQAAAVAVELVHMATLVHDDVLDGARLRRGQPTLLSNYGSRVSTAAGDYLFSSAFETLASAGSPEAISLLARASLDLSQGELLQMRQAGDFGLIVKDYEERCGLKTGSLFAASCCLGAMLSGCSEGTVAALGSFGDYLGLAFQIADDILDFAGDAEETGKLTGTDLRDGTVNLPLIRALERDPGLAGLCRQVRETGEETLVAEACRRVRASGALEAAATEAAACVEQARAALAGIEEIETAPLGMIAEIAADRKV